MILSNDDVNVGKVSGWVTEELPEAEAPNLDRPGRLGPPAVAADDIHCSGEKKRGQSRHSLFV